MKRLPSKELYDLHFDELKQFVFPRLVPSYKGPQFACVSADAQGMGVIRLNLPATTQGYVTPTSMVTLSNGVDVPVITTYTYLPPSLS